MMVMQKPPPPPTTTSPPPCFPFANDNDKIPFSNVTVMPRTKSYWIRKWKAADVVSASTILLMHILCLFAPFTITWSAVATAYILLLVTGLFGMTLSYHRNLTHQSFMLPKWLEYTFAYCGLLALQGDPIFWVSKHRFHHKYTDKAQDPHSPTEGFWFSHMNWIFDMDYIEEKCGRGRNVQDLQKQPYYRFLQRTHGLHHLLLALLLYKFGGFSFLVWGMGVRAVFVYHVTFSVNSACHIWGKQAWNTGDLSKNNWIVALLAFGEGWHNNHHAFENSARHGLEWWQFDTTWLVILMLEYFGLATNVKVPSDIQKEKMSFKNGFEDMKVPYQFQKQSIQEVINNGYCDDVYDCSTNTKRE